MKVEIQNYVCSLAFTNFVKHYFPEFEGDIHDELMKEEYIEGSMGCMWSHGDQPCNVQMWMNKFLEVHNLKHIRIEY